MQAAKTLFLSRARPFILTYFKSIYSHVCGVVCICVYQIERNSHVQIWNFLHIHKYVIIIIIIYYSIPTIDYM